MRKQDRYTPYIRRANWREKAPTLRMAYRLAFYRLNYKHFYVLVQRGWPNLVIEVGNSREDVTKRIVGTYGPVGGFRAWASRIKNFGALRS